MGGLEATMFLALAGLSQLKWYIMEFISVLALVVSLMKVTLMWLNYMDCKKSQKNTDCDK